MTDICFSRRKDYLGGDEVVVFERGRYNTPLVILSIRDIEELNKELGAGFEK